MYNLYNSRCLTPHFDYSGYSKEKLESLCCEKNTLTGYAKWKYWTSEIYSSGKILREYAFYPSLFPLFCYSDHGPGDLPTQIPPHELNNDALFHLCYCKEKVTLFKKFSKKKCYNIISPLAWYRKNKKIVKSKNARGTLFFYAHSTPAINTQFDINKYINDINKLPEFMQPFCFCLHMHDINKGIHIKLLEKGFPVFTAGNAADIRFAERFYEILKNFNYTSSNFLGSYAYYSAEMEIPFFIYGDEVALINNSDENIELGEYKSYKTKTFKSIQQTFSIFQNEVTTEQKKICESRLGIYGSISRWKLSFLLYLSFFKRVSIMDFFIISKHLVQLIGSSLFYKHK